MRSPCMIKSSRFALSSARHGSIQRQCALSSLAADHNGAASHNTTRLGRQTALNDEYRERTRRHGDVLAHRRHHAAETIPHGVRENCLIPTRTISKRHVFDECRRYPPTIPPFTRRTEPLRFHATASGSNSTDEHSQLKHGRFNLLEDLEIVRLHREGYGFPTIASTLRRGLVAVHNRWNRRLKRAIQAGYFPMDKIPTEVRPEMKSDYEMYTKEEDEAIVRLKESGMKMSGIAAKLGRRENSIRDRYQWNLREGATGKSFLEYKDKHTDAMGRKRRQRLTALEAMTMVYLRDKLGLRWIDVAREFPDRSVRVLRASYQKFAPRWEGLIPDDPRKWSADQIKTVSLHASNLAMSDPKRLERMVRQKD